MNRLTLRAIAAQLAVSDYHARKIVTRHAWLARPEGSPPTYDAQFVTRYRAMRGVPHLTIEPVHRDWLARYLGEHLMSQPAPARRRRAAVTEVTGVPGGIDPSSQLQPGAEVIDEDGQPEVELLVYPGELLTQGTTLAIVLPNDTKESYFSSKHVAIIQEGESAEEVILRGIAIVNTSVEANVQDNLDRWAPPSDEATE